MSRRGRKIPTCDSCGAGITWLTSRGNRVPFDRLPVDLEEGVDHGLAMPCYLGEAWPLEDLVVELQATYHYTPGQARTFARERLPWHRQHVCPITTQEGPS